MNFLPYNTAIISDYNGREQLLGTVTRLRARKSITTLPFYQPLTIRYTIKTRYTKGISFVIQTIFPQQYSSLNTLLSTSQSRLLRGYIRDLIFQFYQPLTRGTYISSSEGTLIRPSSRYSLGKLSQIRTKRQASYRSAIYTYMPSLVTTSRASPDILRPKVECFSSIYSFLAGSESSLTGVVSSYCQTAIPTKGCLYRQKLSTTIQTLSSSINSSLIARKAKYLSGKYNRADLIERAGKAESQEETK